MSGEECVGAINENQVIDLLFRRDDLDIATVDQFMGPPLPVLPADSPAEDVAGVICGALSDPKPRFRYTCAWGGVELPRGRAAMSDGEWVSLGLAASDEEYYREFERLFGLDLRTSG